jgi:hypothetical protein
MKKFPIPKTFSRSVFWAIPLVSLTSFVPIVVTYFTPDNPSSENPAKISPLPPLSQIPPSSEAWKQSLINVDPVISASPSPTVKPPQPIPSASPKPNKPNHQANSSAKSKPSPSQPQHHSQKAKHPAKAYQKGSQAFVPPSSQYTPPPLEIKVAVWQDASSTTVGASNGAAILDSNGRTLRSLPSNQGFSVQAAGASLNLGDWQLPGVVWLQPSDGGLVFVGDRWYRGKLLLVSQGNSLVAVNYVDLEHYLYSVVGSEMHPTAPMAALKAQAIAARSYALVHMIRPASPLYHLGATQRWQVYKGVEREYNTSQQAVQETSGQVLSYRGGVVESLYAATDDIVSSVHGGRGMSQTGAYQLAAQGYDYQQILNRYYPGVGLARLVLHQ